jgi:hypothetical protein
VLEAGRETGAVITVEGHSIRGGLGEACASLLVESGVGVPFRRVGFPAEDTVTGSQKAGSGSATIAEALGDLVAIHPVYRSKYFYNQGADAKRGGLDSLPGNRVAMPAGRPFSLGRRAGWSLGHGSLRFGGRVEETRARIHGLRTSSGHENIRCALRRMECCCSPGSVEWEVDGRGRNGYE